MTLATTRITPALVWAWFQWLAFSRIKCAIVHVLKFKPTVATTLSLRPKCAAEELTSPLIEVLPTRSTAFDLGI